MENRNVSLLMVLLAFLIASLLFVSGFLIGYAVSYYKLQDVYQKQNEIRYKLLGLELENKFIESCDEFVLHSVSSELDKMGSIMSILEERFGKNDEKVIEQKKGYSLIEIRHFLNIKEYRENCKKNITTILFFYSNDKEYIDEAEKMGYILGNLKKEYPEKIMIYSFDYNLDLNILKILKHLYNVTSPNTIIINEKIKLEKLENIEEIRKYL